VEERLLAHPVPRQHQPLQSIVPEGEGKHAAQPLWRITPVLFIRVYDDLCIASSIKGVAERFELAAQLPVVVDFSVEDNPYSLILIVNRLIPCNEIDHRQPSDSQSNRRRPLLMAGHAPTTRIHVVACAVGATMDHCVAHSVEHGFVKGPAISVSYSSYSAQE